MSLTTMLVTLVIFVIGVAIGWRLRVGSLYVLFFLILAFAALDYAIEKITLWPVTHWVIVDLIAVQIGYFIGAALGFLNAERKARDRREPG